MPESLTLDPTSENASNTPVELMSNGVRLMGHSYPAPPIDVQYAGSVDTEGDVPASRRPRNRTITLSVECTTQAALELLEAKVAKIGREGGTLKRVLSTGETIVFDLLVVDGYEPTFDQLYHLGGVTAVQMSFVAEPLGRGTPVTLSDHAETTLPALIFTETGLLGNVPGLLDIMVDNDSINGQGTLMWGIRSANYSAASTAAPLIQAESLTLVNGAILAAGTAPASGSGNNVVRKQISGGAGGLTNAQTAYITTGTMTHTGDYRVFARVRVSTLTTGTVSVQFTYTAGGLQSVSNDEVSIDPSREGTWILVDLGYLSSEGTWSGSFLAKSTVNNDGGLDVDYLLFLPIDDGDGQIVETLGGTGSAMQASSSTRITSSEVLVENGSAWSRPHFSGKYPKLPVASTVQFVFKAMTGSLDRPSVTHVAADSAIDDISAQITYTPRYLVMPDA